MSKSDLSVVSCQWLQTPDGVYSNWQLTTDHRQLTTANVLIWANGVESGVESGGGRPPAA